MHSYISYFLFQLSSLCTSNILQLVQILFASEARLRTINPIFFVSREVSDSTLNFERNVFIQEKKDTYYFASKMRFALTERQAGKNGASLFQSEIIHTSYRSEGSPSSLLLFSVFSTVRLPLMTVFTQLPAATAESFGLILAKDGERD